MSHLTPIFHRVFVGNMKKNLDTPIALMRVRGYDPQPIDRDSGRVHLAGQSVRCRQGWPISDISSRTGWHHTGYCGVKMGRQC